MKDSELEELNINVNSQFTEIDVMREDKDKKFLEIFYLFAEIIKKYYHRNQIWNELKKESYTEIYLPSFYIKLTSESTYYKVIVIQKLSKFKIFTKPKSKEISFFYYPESNRYDLYGSLSREYNNNFVIDAINEFFLYIQILNEKSIRQLKQEDEKMKLVLEKASSLSEVIV